MELIGKIPPQCVEVEEAVLGALMLESEAYYKVVSILNDTSFYKPEHNLIFKCIEELAKADIPINLLTVAKSIKDKGQIDFIGGPVYIAQLTSRVSSAVHIEHHAKIIAQTALKRQLIKIGIETTEQAYDESTDIDELLNELKNKIQLIEEFSTGSETGKSQEDVINEAVIEMERDCTDYKNGIESGVTTGLHELDRATGGWKKTNIIVLASRPGIGKTSLCLHFAESAAKKGKWVNFYGLEMSRSDLMRINISGESGVNRIDIRDGRIQDQDWDKINESVTKISKLPIIWNDHRS